MKNYQLGEAQFEFFIFLLASFFDCMKVPSGPPHEVAAKLVCQCGCNLVLADCPHEECPSRPLLVEKIQAHLASGLSVDQTAQAMASQYGGQILAAPPFLKHPLPWILPSAALSGGALLVMVLMKKWAAAPRKAAASKAGARPDLVERLERDMKEDQ